jgi:hypothetical protein
MSPTTSPLIDRFLAPLHLNNAKREKRLVAVAQAVSVLPWGEGRTVEEVLLTKHAGTCTGKHLVLQACLDALGIEWKPVVCTFRWSEQGIALPDDCRAILAGGEWDHGHNFIQIRDGNGQWIDLDVTWDRLLAPQGFRCLPTEWDGGTPFIGLQSFMQRWDGVSMQEKKQELIDGLTPVKRERRELFLHSFIAWIASLRRNA